MLSDYKLQFYTLKKRKAGIEPAFFFADFRSGNEAV